MLLVLADSEDRKNEEQDYTYQASPYVIEWKRSDGSVFDEGSARCSVINQNIRNASIIEVAMKRVSAVLCRPTHMYQDHNHAGV